MRSSASGFPVSILQKPQRRVHLSPPIKNVASLSSQHSKIFGQAASWQTVCKPSLFTSVRRRVYSGPILARVLIHSGLRSIGTSELRASTRSNLRPSGANVMHLPFLERQSYGAALREQHHSRLYPYLIPWLTRSLQHLRCHRGLSGRMRSYRDSH